MEFCGPKVNLLIKIITYANRNSSKTINIILIVKKVGTIHIHFECANDDLHKFPKYAIIVHIWK